MDLTHQFTVPAALDEAWEAFNRPDRIASCFPGATVSSIDGEDTFTGSMKVKVGPIALAYVGTGTFGRRDFARRKTVIRLKGTDKRGNGAADATITASFSTADEGTAIEVLTDLVITGKPAQFGRGVIQDVTDRLVDQFVDCMTTSFANGFEPARSPGADDEPTEQTVEPPAAGGPNTPRPAGTSYQPPKLSGSTDLSVLSSLAPVLKRVAPPLAGALVLLWIISKVVGRRK